MKSIEQDLMKSDKEIQYLKAIVFDKGEDKKENDEEEQKQENNENLKE